jgi:hypothetical protein
VHHHNLIINKLYKIDIFWFVSKFTISKQIANKIKKNAGGLERFRVSFIRSDIKIKNYDVQQSEENKRAAIINQNNFTGQLATQIDNCHKKQCNFNGC